MGGLQSFLQNIPSKDQAETVKDPFLNRFENFLKQTIEPDLKEVSTDFQAKGLQVFKELPESETTSTLPTVEKSWIFDFQDRSIKDSDVFKLPYISFMAYRQTGKLKVSFVNAALPGLNTSIEDFDQAGFENLFKRFLERSLALA